MYHPTLCSKAINKKKIDLGKLAVASFDAEESNVFVEREEPHLCRPEGSAYIFIRNPESSGARFPLSIKSTEVLLLISDVPLSTFVPVSSALGGLRNEAKGIIHNPKGLRARFSMNRSRLQASSRPGSLVYPDFLGGAPRLSLGALPHSGVQTFHQKSVYPGAIKLKLKGFLMGTRRGRIEKGVRGGRPEAMCEGRGVWGVGWGVQVIGCRVQGAGCRV